MVVKNERKNISNIEIYLGTFNSNNCPNVLFVECYMMIFAKQQNLFDEESLGVEK